jgi:FlaA1/EpsC-like NDP-sugar epimerase
MDSLYILVSRLAEYLLALPRRVKQVLMLVLDTALVIIAAPIAHSLRVGILDFTSEAVAKIWMVTVPAAIVLFALTGVYSAIFRYAGIGMLRGLLRTFLIYGILMTATFTLGGIDGVPRTIGMIQPMLLFILVAASRITLRFLFVEMLGRHQHTGSIKRILIYGAGNAGQQIAASLRSEPDINVVGFVDDDKRLAGKKLDGGAIYWSGNIAKVLSKNQATDILLALPSASRRRRRAIVEGLRDFKVAVQTLPPVRDLAGGRVTTSDIRPLAIEDLLGREPVAPNPELFGRTISRKNVLVSGAGGSIGSELCRQIAQYGAAKLVMLEMSEFSLYQIEKELVGRIAKIEGAEIELVPVLGSVTDRAKLDEVLRQHSIQTVYHAAAYKHVPLVEANPIEAVRNNILGTFELVRASAKAQISDFILISTDKAVRPTNVMGATKRAAEQVVQSFAKRSKTTRFSMVRFGNVLGSSGSVVPLFRKQIEEGGPITLTDKQITRFFMTIPEAAGLVIQAAGMAEGGEMFVLDMGKPVSIEKLARTMVQLSGLTVRDNDNPDGDIDIVEVGLRPGEKLYEELLIGESPENTEHKRIMKAHEGFLPWTKLSARLKDIAATREPQVAVEILQAIVPEFNHQPLGDERSKAAKSQSD